MTKLEIAVTRQTNLIVGGREVDVTFEPANPTTCTPEGLVLHLKGLKSCITIPLPAILKAVGWKVDSTIAKTDKNAEFDALMTSLEVALRPWKEAT
jgi:hypothetical protein